MEKWLNGNDPVIQQVIKILTEPILTPLSTITGYSQAIHRALKYMEINKIPKFAVAANNNGTKLLIDLERGYIWWLANDGAWPLWRLSEQEMKSVIRNLRLGMKLDLMHQRYEIYFIFKAHLRDLNDEQ